MEALSKVENLTEGLPMIVDPVRASLPCHPFAPYFPPAPSRQPPHASKPKVLHGRRLPVFPPLAGFDPIRPAADPGRKGEAVDARMG